MRLGEVTVVGRIPGNAEGEISEIGKILREWGAVLVKL